MSDEFNPPHAPRAASRPDAPRPAAQADHPLRLGAIVIVLAGIVVLQFVVAVASMGVLSALRAYVAGESLYSKGQKDALLYLHEYVESHVEDDYRNFRRALTVPLGDRIAREALKEPTPDRAAARAGFLVGGNHPEDIDGLIWAFAAFRSVPFMADAIATWTEGDIAIEEMRSLVERAHERIAAGDAQAQAVRDLRERAPQLNDRLTQLEVAFSERLGAASRQTQWLLLMLNLGVAAMLLASGGRFVRNALRMQARVHDEVRRGAQRSSQLVDAVNEGVITLDGDGHIILFNRTAAALFGVSPDEAVGQSIERFIPDGLPGGGDLRAASPVPGDTAAGPARGVVHELNVPRPDGEALPLEISLSELHTEDGVLTTVVIRDMTDVHAARAERQARELVEAASRAKTEFLSRMSHELRTPLNAVLGFSQLMRHDAAQPLARAQDERLQHIECAGQHLLALVNDVLDLSRVEARQTTMTLETVNLHDEVSESLALLSATALRSGVTLNAADVGVLVTADRLRLRQVLLNLLGNAVKYNRAGGRVDVAWVSRCKDCQITITDTGCGMTPSQLAQLYQPFNRLGAESTGVEGTGIGLVIVRGLVELMHGHLQVDSVMGRGTVVTLTLPLADQPFACDTNCPLTPEAEERPLRVLYAEDDLVNIELVRQIVSLRANTELRVAQSGALALAMAREEVPDVMLVDMHLGDMSGTELWRKLSRELLGRRPRAIALSADALPETIAAALAAGFADYLAKPVDFTRLLQVLEHAADAAAEARRWSRMRPRQGRPVLPVDAEPTAIGAGHREAA